MKKQKQKQEDEKELPVVPIYSNLFLSSIKAKARHETVDIEIVLSTEKDKTGTIRAVMSLSNNEAEKFAAQIFRDIGCEQGFREATQRERGW